MDCWCTQQHDASQKHYAEGKKSDIREDKLGTYIIVIKLTVRNIHDNSQKTHDLEVIV